MAVTSLSDKKKRWSRPKRQAITTACQIGLPAVSAAAFRRVRSNIRLNNRVRCDGLDKLSKLPTFFAQRFSRSETVGISKAFAGALQMDARGVCLTVSARSSISAGDAGRRCGCRTAWRSRLEWEHRGTEMRCNEHTAFIFDAEVVRATPSIHCHILHTHHHASDTHSLRGNETRQAGQGRSLPEITLRSRVAIVTPAPAGPRSPTQPAILLLDDAAPRLGVQQTAGVHRCFNSRVSILTSKSPLSTSLHPQLSPRP
ncbi:hypothetical protein C8R45DRAFT_4722 [Mycena sanguinolenta]|nr:hypothetical protein C8R45DRAFT_4722 [Mycena sanguinolenta]